MTADFDSIEVGLGASQKDAFLCQFPEKVAGVYLHAAYIAFDIFGPHPDDWHISLSTFNQNSLSLVHAQEPIALSSADCCFELLVPNKLCFGEVGHVKGAAVLD